MGSPAKQLLDWICAEIEAQPWINAVDRDVRVEPLYAPPCAKVIKLAEPRRYGTPLTVRDYIWSVYIYYPGIKKVDEQAIIDDRNESLRLIFEEREGLFPFHGICPDEDQYIGFKVDDIVSLGKPIMSFGSVKPVKSNRLNYLMQISLPVIPSSFRARQGNIL